MKPEMRRRRPGLADIHTGVGLQENDIDRLREVTLSMHFPHACSKILTLFHMQGSNSCKTEKTHMKLTCPTLVVWVPNIVFAGHLHHTTTNLWVCSGGLHTDMFVSTPSPSKRKPRQQTCLPWLQSATFCQDIDLHSGLTSKSRRLDCHARHLRPLGRHYPDKHYISVSVVIGVGLILGDLSSHQPREFLVTIPPPSLPSILTSRSEQRSGAMPVRNTGSLLQTRMRIASTKSTA